MSVSEKTLEMSYTEAEFRKNLLGQFIQNRSFSATELNARQWQIRLSKNTFVDIKIAQAKPRKIAVLCLPVLNTRLEFNGLSASQKNEFMTRFWRYFHKGGG